MGDDDRYEMAMPQAPVLPTIRNGSETFKTWQQTGATADKIQRLVDGDNPDAFDEFMSLIERGEHHWLWTGRLSGPDKLYPVATIEGFTISAARVAWAIAGNKLSNSIHLKITCGEPRCVNPAHMEAVSRGVASRGMFREPKVLHEADVIRIHEQFAAGVTIDKIAATYDLNRYTVARILTGRSWRHLMPKSKP
jgi:hypothetical protein